jgi:hypothetical protein
MELAILATPQLTVPVAATTVKPSETMAHMKIKRISQWSLPNFLVRNSLTMIGFSHRGIPDFRLLGSTM